MRISDFLLERYFNKYEFKAPYLLSSSDCESLSIGELLSLDPHGDKKTQLQKVWLGYTESEGDPELRSKIAALYGKLTKDNILCFSGAEEGIFILLNVLLNPGDHIIVQFPAYQSLYEIAQAIGCRVSKWEIEDHPARWEFNVDTLEKMVEKSTKLIIINQPHNPTGALISKEDFARIVQIAREHRIYLLSDEVYRFLEYNPSDTLPAACDLYENAFSLGVFSKSYGLAGLRIGWIATQDLKIRAKMSAYKDYTTICNSAPSEFLAEFALDHADQIIKRNLGIIETNLKLLDEFFKEFSYLFEWRKPRAGSIAFVKLKNGLSASEFCRNHVENAGILLLPSHLYHYGDYHFRIGFGRKNISEIIPIWRKFLLNNYPEPS